MDDVFISVGGCRVTPCPLKPLLEAIPVKLSELATQLTTIDAKLTEASAEIVIKIAELQAALADADVPEGTAQLVADIGDKAAALADIVPNETPAG